MRDFDGDWARRRPTPYACSVDPSRAPCDSAAAFKGDGNSTRRLSSFVGERLKQRHFPALLIPALELHPKLRSAALRFLGKQVIDCPVNSHAGLEMLVLPGQIEPQARIPIAAELCVDYLLGIQHVLANTFDRLVLVHVAGCIVLLETLAQLLLLADAMQRAGAHHSQKAITFA